MLVKMREAKTTIEFDIWKRLVELARREGRSTSNLVRRFIADGMMKMEAGQTADTETESPSVCVAA